MVLYEDDGGWDPALNPVTLEWNAEARLGSVRRPGGPAAPRYEVTAWKHIG